MTMVRRASVRSKRASCTPVYESRDTAVSTSAAIRTRAMLDQVPKRPRRTERGSRRRR